MIKKNTIIGRKEEQVSFERYTNSKKSEFIAVYGRRRVGKTYLIREFYDSTFDFQITGISNATTSQQIFNFENTLSKHSNILNDKKSENWLEAFQKLIGHIETIKEDRKKIIFFDELPWFDTKASDFMIGLEHFWNSWASNRKDILLIVCGSAASWMLNELINNTGGLHNRITQKMKIEPFNLNETEQMLKANNCVIDRYQIVQLYMTMGGIPYYLDLVQPQYSATQNIQKLFFDKSSILKNEFNNLYRSLFTNYDVYEKIVETLSTKNEGLNKTEIIQLSGVKSGGTLTKVLFNLIESGFVSTYTSLDNKNKNTIYRLSDYYTLFYFKYIKNGMYKGENSWINLLDNPNHRAWQGFTFEQICMDHIRQIKTKLGISGIQSQNVSWKGATSTKKAQIDLLIDRRDQVINICECKFSINTFDINKDYAEKLASKINTFKTSTNTKKSVFLTMITTYGVENNKYAHLVQNEVVMGDLFGG
jgi:uncharacterized protein